MKSIPTKMVHGLFQKTIYLFFNGQKMSDPQGKQDETTFTKGESPSP